MRGVVLALLLAITASPSSSTVLMDASGSLHRQLPSVSTSNGVVAVISSPGTQTLFGASSEILSLDQETPYASLSCRGSTLGTTSASERTSLAATSLAADAVVLEGITEGDVETGLRFTRHARTLSALMRARLLLAPQPDQPQTLILSVDGPVDESMESALKSEVQSIFEAASVESKDYSSFSDMYDVKVVSVQTQDDARQVMTMASEAARSRAQDSTLSTVLSDAQNKIRETGGVTTEALDPPQVAQAYLRCRQAYARQARTARAKLTAWKSRVARGLVVDGFGNEAENLCRRALQGYDTETLESAGLALVAPYRLEMRSQLQSMIETSLQELYDAQVSNLEKSTLKKFQAQLLRKQGTAASEESAYNENAAAMRSAAFAHDTALGDLEVASLGLTKAKASRDMSAKINDALATFPDSPAAQLKRMKVVKQTVSKDRKPGERSVDVGLDVVAMIRPDGFGSLQGFAGYQFGGNSVTVGLHNDADDASIIAQMGGVRPPLFRIQPKLRVDVEL